MILPPDHPLRIKVYNDRHPEHFAQTVLGKLPLADAFLSLYSYVLEPSFLNRIFEQHRGRCYEDLITFPQLVGWLFDALVEHRGSGRQAFSNDPAKQPTCSEAFYGKLRRMPLSASLGFLSETTQHLQRLFPAVRAHQLPASLDEFDVIAIDGKKLKRVAKRLLPTRGAPGKLFGGKLLVAWQPRNGLVVHMAAHLDGEVNEARLVPDLLPTVREGRRRPCLWIADRQFGDLVQTKRFAEGNDHFVVRHHKKTHFHPDPSQPTLCRRDSSGRLVEERWGWIGSETDPRRRAVRQITLHRVAEEAIVLLTDLLGAQAYPGADLLAVYLIRWGIEQVFQRVTDVFELKRFISTTPQATIFQASMCFVIYNLMQVVKGYVVLGKHKSTEDLSCRQIYRDFQNELTALRKMLSMDEVLSLIPTDWMFETMVDYLKDRLVDLWKPKWEKCRNRKPRPKRTPKKQNGAHTSAQRLIDKHQVQKTNEPDP